MLLLFLSALTAFESINNPYEHAVPVWYMYDEHIKIDMWCGEKLHLFAIRSEEYSENAKPNST